MFNVLSKIFRANRSREKVLEILTSIRNRTISDGLWDGFISIKIYDPELEQVRRRMAEIWTHNSPYMLSGSSDPRDLNPKGIAEVQRLIRSLETRVEAKTYSTPKTIRANKDGDPKSGRNA